MLVYTVYEPPLPAQSTGTRAEDLVFVRDGFSMPALILGPIWLIGRRLWLALVLYAVAVLLLLFVLRLLAASSAAVAGMLTLFALLFGHEAETLQRWTLERRGYRALGTVAGKTFADCELRFLERWLGNERASQAMASDRTTVPAPAQSFMAAPAAQAPASPWPQVPLAT